MKFKGEPDVHTYFMRECLIEAQKAFDQGEVPVGAILVKDEAIVGRSFNQNEQATSAMQHAELMLLDRVSKLQKNWRLLDFTLYVTLEPCVMCSGAIFLSRIPRVVFGCKNPKGGAIQFIQDRHKELNLNHSVEVLGGVLEPECSDLLKQFFSSRRK